MEKPFAHHEMAPYRRHVRGFWGLEIKTMLRRLSRISFLLVLLLSSEVWALGLGEIRLDSALNEPLRAEIELLSATSEELSALTVAMADSMTFDRYGLDRPVFLQSIEFMVVGNKVEVRSRAPVTEPFVTFLVEASWSRGRLLREYTILLDPPTFAPPTQTQPAVSAPQRSTPTDSGRIGREQPAAAPPQSRDSQSTAQSRPPVRSEPSPQPVADNASYSSTNGSEVYVERRQTLWGIAQRHRPDSRLTMNQTMLAIYEANPDAFGGNINLLRAGASLRIPSADEIFQISRGDALSEVKRQNTAWDDGSGAVAPVEAAPRPSLTLVPPDEEVVADSTSDDFDSGLTEQPLTREQEIEQDLARLEAEPVPEQASLIEIRNDELASMREELARIRGEVYEPVADDSLDEVIADDELIDDSVADDGVVDSDDDVVGEGADDLVVEDQDGDVADATPATNVITTRPSSEPGFIDKAIGALTGIWGGIIGALVLVVGLLFWFMRRGRDEDDLSASLEPLDADEMPHEISGDEEMAATETLRAPIKGDESFLVVEQDSAIRPMGEETIETSAPAFPAPELVEPKDTTGSLETIDDTFSAETAINLDKSDPVAEADFHMAYGLYDQAADLVNGALEIEPERQDLLTKLCEIYFVWGNRDAFVDAAGRLKAAIGGEESADWDKIVIMGQQIAADDALFVGAGTAAATMAVDLSFEAGAGDISALDMELGSEGDSGGDVVDLGMADSGGDTDDDGIDFLFDDGDRDTSGDSTLNFPMDTDFAAEMAAAEVTVETPTIEEQFDVLGGELGVGGTAELPALDSSIEQPAEPVGHAADETAEINLDDLGLDISEFAETEIASLDDLDVTSESEVLDLTEATGRNPEVDPDSTGVRRALSGDATGMMESLADMDIGDISGTNATLNLDSNVVEALPEDYSPEESLLDATGMTQVLGEDFTVEDATGMTQALGDDFTVEMESAADSELSDADETLLAPGYGDDDTVETPIDDEKTISAGPDDDADFNFAKTEALPPDVFTGDANPDATGEMPALASADFDLDLDDLTAALQMSEIGDTVDQPRDDATIEQPRPDAAASADDSAETMALAPGETHEDLHDARTMTEVGTKLDLARAYVDMGDPAGARSILEEVLDEGDESQRQQAQQLLESLA